MLPVPLYRKISVYSMSAFTVESKPEFLHRKRGFRFQRRKKVAMLNFWSCNVPAIGSLLKNEKQIFHADSA